MGYLWKHFQSLVYHVKNTNREMLKDKILVAFEYLKRNVPNKLFFKFERLRKKNVEKKNENKLMNSILFQIMSHNFSMSHPYHE